MCVNKKLNTIISWLENSDNEALIVAEKDDKCLKKVAELLITASSMLKEVSTLIESEDDNQINHEHFEELANLATALDASNDPALIKQASVLDEILLTIASNPELINQQKKINKDKIREYRQQFAAAKEQAKHDYSVKDKLDKINGIDEAEKRIEKSKILDQGKTKRPLSYPLLSRTCPDHAGAMISRVGDGQYQCELDHKIYDFVNGYTKLDGTKVPGGTVDHQTDLQHISLNTVNTSDRQSRMNDI